MDQGTQAALDDLEDPSTRISYPLEWFVQRVAYWQQVLRLSSWSLTIKSRPGTPKEAESEMWPGETAIITFREDQCLEDAENTVVHELLHIRYFRYERVRDKMLAKIGSRLAKGVAEAVGVALHETYEDALESTARALVALNAEKEAL